MAKLFFSAMHFLHNHHERVVPLPDCSSFLIVLLVAFIWHSLLIARCSSAPLQSDSASAHLPANYRQQQQRFPGSQSLPAPSQTSLKVLCVDTNAEDLRHRLGHAFNERYMAFERPANAVEGPSHLVALMDRLAGSGQTQAGTRYFLME